MDLKKLAPWNWFKNEEESHIPVFRDEAQNYLPDNLSLGPMLELHREMNRLFDAAYRGFGRSPFSSEVFTPLIGSGQLKPQVDISATAKEYCITVEVPGVSEKDVKVEIANDLMTIKGEKKTGERGERRELLPNGAFLRFISTSPVPAGGCPA